MAGKFNQLKTLSFTFSLKNTRKKKNTRQCFVTWRQTSILIIYECRSIFTLIKNLHGKSYVRAQSEKTAKKNHFFQKLHKSNKINGKFLLISEVTNRRFCSRYRSMLSPFFPTLSHSAHTFFIFSLYYFPNTVKTNNKKRKERKKKFILFVGWEENIFRPPK